MARRPCGVFHDAAARREKIGESKMTRPRQLSWRSAHELRTQICEGCLSASEAIRTHLAVIAARNQDLNALVEVFSDEAVTQAAHLDQKRVAGETLGPLAGVPVSVKSNIDVAGHPTTHGIKAFQRAIPPSDSPLVVRLRRADAILIGHSNMPDLSMRLHTSSQMFGATRSTVAPELTPGGSSGGDAVAVAADMCLLGLGNDAGGSLRVPASFNGICSLKPTPGRFPSDRAIGRDVPFAAQVIPVDGFLAHSIKDLEIAFAISAGADLRDPRSLPLSQPSTSSSRRTIAVVLDPGGSGTHPEIQQAVARAASVLEQSGYTLEWVDVPELEATLSNYRGLILTEFAQSWPILQRLVGQDVRRYLDYSINGCPPLNLREYIAATAERMRLQRVWNEFAHRYHVVLGPVFCQPIPEVDADIKSAESNSACGRAMRLCTASSLVGLPAVSFSVSSTSHLPIGVQLITPPFEESRALTLANEVTTWLAREDS
jgi:amidase